ncbi:protein LKAAEAR1 isoform X1 [Alligator sinensis]|uniref:Protein LKAAEAR1 isoform X1 n=2 Tax=Alligator sinensis TaxID=38654 RepID=A0A3Q0GH68_ALLSI|nr:protein LKAAEAR1 isoform X1 [Alligator sinensis]
MLQGRTASGPPSGAKMTAKGADAHKKKIPPAPRKNLLPFDAAGMSPQQRSRYLAFVEPTEEIVKSILASPAVAMEKMAPEYIKRSGDAEQKKQARVIGLLKAAEARNRLRNLRLRFQDLRAQEINHLISCQKTARGALRLEAFLPPRKNMQKLADCLDTVQRSRVEEILEDKTGEIFIRRP